MLAIAAPTAHTSYAEHAWEQHEESGEDTETEKNNEEHKEETCLVPEISQKDDRIHMLIALLPDNGLIWHTRQPPTPPPNEAN